MKPPRVVLDTNCVVSALIFPAGKIAWLRQAWQSSRFTPLVSRNTAAELIRVLRYPKFKLTPAERESLLADFLPYTEAVRLTPPPGGLPKVRDPNDEMFVTLAVAAKADALVSGDADIQAVERRFGRILILSPAEFAAWLERSRNY